MDAINTREKIPPPIQSSDRTEQENDAGDIRKVFFNSLLFLGVFVILLVYSLCGVFAMCVLFVPSPTQFYSSLYGRRKGVGQCEVVPHRDLKES
jgi:hypothetical protein